MAKELRGILGERPITDEELNKVKNQKTLELAGRWETIGAVAGSIADLVAFGLPDDYFAQYAGKVRSLELAPVNAAAKQVVFPENLVWVVVGDRAKIEAPLRELGWGEVRLIDTDGNPVK